MDPSQADPGDSDSKGICENLLPWYDLSLLESPPNSTMFNVRFVSESIAVVRVPCVGRQAHVRIL